MNELIIFLILQNIKIISSQLILPQNLNSDQLDECVNKITKNIESHYILRMSFSSIEQNMNYNNSYYVSNDESVNILDKDYSLNVYILKFKNTDDLFLWLNQVNHLKGWNSGGKFVIYVDEYNLKDEIMAILWEFFIMNVILILKIENFEAYTYYPYNLINCQNDLTAKHIFSCNDTVPSEIFPEKVPNNLFGCTIKLFAFPYRPFVIDTSANRDDATKVGLEIAMMHAFAVKMNFKEEYIKHNYSGWGFLLPNGTWTDIYGGLQVRKFDFAFGRIAIGDMTHFEGIYQGLIYSALWYVPTANEKFRWSTVFQVFNPVLWFSLFTSAIVTGIITWIFNKINRDAMKVDNYLFINKKILIYIENSCKILLAASVKLPINTSTRIIIISWIMFCMLINTVYQSQLMSILQEPQMEHQISTFKEMLESDLNFGTSIILEAILDTPEYDPIRSKFVVCPLNDKCLNRTAFEQDIAVVKTGIYAEYMSKNFYLNAQGKSRIFAIRDYTLLWFYPEFLVLRGYPLRDKLQAFIQQLHSNGLILKWYNDLVATEAETAEAKISPLTIYDEFCAFIILIFGLILSTLAFIIENIVYKRKNKYN